MLFMPEDKFLLEGGENSTSMLKPLNIGDRLTAKRSILRQTSSRNTTDSGYRWGTIRSESHSLK